LTIRFNDSPCPVFGEHFRVPDDVWLERVASEDWVIISSDRGKKYGGPKLPRFCEELSITHILISASLHQEKQFEKARAIVYLFPELIEIATAQERGSRFSMRYNSARNPILVPAK
jgi:hypothetical protein